MRRFGARTDDGLSIVVNSLTVRSNSCWLGERVSIVSDVCVLRTNEVYQIVDSSRFFVRDLEKERSNGLSKSCEVGVGRLSDDRLEVVEGWDEFCHNLLGRHGAPKIARPLC